MDFTIAAYKELLHSILFNSFDVSTFSSFVRNSNSDTIILRHDVDALPQNSLRFAQIQAVKNIRASYYFRVVPKSWDEKIIKKIADLGHEVGYHYENMDTCNGDVEKAWNDFRYNLDKLRKLVEVNTICMHGSPRSKFDNKALWKKYDYKSLGIIGEPYYDIDFNKVFYLTDTSRRWDGWKSSVRDKVPQQEKWTRQGLIYHSTKDIINSINKDTFPRQVMFTFHPQRWHDQSLLWLKELLLQNMKNVVKSVLVKKRPQRHTV